MAFIIQLQKTNWMLYLGKSRRENNREVFISQGVISKLNYLKRQYLLVERIYEQQST